MRSSGCHLCCCVGGALFEFATGILNIQYSYVFQFFFTTAHYYGAWVFTAAFLFHSWSSCDDAQGARDAAGAGAAA